MFSQIYFIKVINCRALTCYNSYGLQFRIYPASFYSFFLHSDANYDRELPGVHAKYLANVIHGYSRQVYRTGEQKIFIKCVDEYGV